MAPIVKPEVEPNPELESAIRSIERVLDDKCTIQQTLEIYFTHLYRMAHELPITVRPFIARSFREVADIIERDYSSPSSSASDV